jgi:hypothetical protein
MKLNKPGLLIVFFTGALWPQGLDTARTVIAENDTGSVVIKNLGIRDSEIWKPDPVRRFNSVIAGAASIILPGAGQVYTHHYVKTGFFLALEGAFGGFVYFWNRTAKDRDAEEQRWLLQAVADTNAFDKALKREESFLSRHGAVDARFSMYSYVAWAAGGYVFNVLDALGSSNVFKNSKPKNPATAGLLAAVPGLGLGQWYNGSLSKAGMVMMGQVSLLLMSYNSHRLMSRAEDNYKRLTLNTADSIAIKVGEASSVNSRYPYKRTWSDTRYRAFTNRNMYLWYSVFFYGYSIFDAVVDASLHEYSEKMKIKPDLVIGPERIYFSLQTTF